MRRMLALAAGGLLAATMAAAAVAQDSPAADVVAAFPEHLASLYENYVGEVVPAQLPEIAAGEKPWKMCHSESYQGNPWRIAFSNEFKRLADEFIAAGTLSEWKQSDANGDVQVQIQQMQAFIDEGCDIITLIPGSPDWTESSTTRPRRASRS